MLRPTEGEMMKLKRLYETFADIEGHLCVRVPLANTTRCAILYVEDFFRLVNAGVSWNWALNYSSATGPGYLKVTIPGDGRRSVARLVAEAGEREQVRYRNGDKIDLRRSNLLVQKGQGRLNYGTMLAELKDAEAA